MKPGRDMDALVAREIMDNPFVEPERPYEYPPPCKHCGHWCSDDCHYSTEDDAAWPVVRAMWDEGFCVWIENPAQLGGYVDAAFSTNGLINGSGNSESFAEAVCVAALRALGVTLEGDDETRS